ncbi:eukaryotic translation initiation factor 4E transporter [Trichonephila inaurata madagascariensis]|uniref:Eukaryotic translation initiation factor 4E transporter n=1 Tax=Trichonephila inaurata madagascariensis TaxID=2747483 RepID=A0A8X6XCH2_9ARAC|nr:eukaryotic translation initiation factor 4E transporter [Trichonephila inaurata madagascariensis]
MAMVRQLTEGEIVNGSTPEDEGQSSEPTKCLNNSRPPSRSSSAGSKRNSPTLPALQYSKEELMKFSNSPLSKVWPSRLDPAYNNATGKWDPERWFMNHRSDRLMPLEEPRSKRERQEDGIVSHKRKSSDPKERIKEEKDDIVLSPQRRSFGTGCHVIQQSSLARRPGSPTDGRDSESFREPTRRIGSGRIISRDRDQRDWDRDREYGYGSRNDRRDRFDQEDSDKDLRRYSGRYNRSERRSRGGRGDRIDEVEPEWFSSGPTSQSETIELVGFEDGEGRKPAKKKRSKQNSRRSSLKSDEGERSEPAQVEDKGSQKKNNESKQEEVKQTITEIREMEETGDSNKSTNTGFDLEQLFKMDWIPGLIQNEAPPENTDKEIGCSRFSQWFRKESPVPEGNESGNNSRRSSLHEELIVNVLNSIVEPQITIPSSTENSSDNYFAPISPALSHSPNYSLPQTMPSSTSKDIMEILQSANSGSESVNGVNPKEPAKTVQELEANLKRIVLGDKKPSEEKSAFDKLLQHMSDSNNQQTASMSMGPLDKSKALQEQDLLQDMLGGPHRSSPPVQKPFNMFEDKQTIFKMPSGVPSTYSQQNQSSQNNAFVHLLQQKQHEQQLQQLQQQQMQEQQQLQNNLQHNHTHNPNVGMQGFTLDVLSKILNNQAQASISPTSPGLQQSSSGQSLNRNDQSSIQYQRQQELLSSILKQQQQQQHSVHNLSQRNVLQSLQQRRCPSAKEIPIQQTLALPTLGISPRQSPMPVDTISSAISNQGRIPSPLVFGQQPPALSHAPAPIHPAALVQAMSQTSASPNTLQVQNPVVLQRVPSPQELAVHTQSILQNALIKRKLEEQKENYRKRQEAQRSTSPISGSKNGIGTSPLKGLSPTIAFTPTSVMRKIQSEKTENKEQKISQQNGTKFPGSGDIRVPDASQNYQKTNSGGLSSLGICTGLDCNFGTINNSLTSSQNTSNLPQGPRAVHGQAMSQPRSIHGVMNSVNPSLSMPNQGRPIVKVGMNQSINPSSELSRSSMMSNKANVSHKSFLSSNNQAHNVHHDVDSNFDLMNKYQWSQLSRQQNVSNVPAAQLQMAATYAALNRPNLNAHHSSLMRPVNIASAANVPSSNINFPVLRNTVQNPIRAAQTSSINQLNHLGQIAALHMQRNAIDSRQLQALAQSQRIHPAALQQLLLNSQNQATAQAQVVGGFPGNRESKHQHLLPGQPGTNRQSPVNLAKWFGNDVLKQKMPEMPPTTQQKALLVEEVERQQQQSTAVHN